MLVAGEQGWIVLTRDKAIRERPEQAQVVLRAKLRIFSLQTRRINREIIVEVFTKQWERILRFIAENEPPFIASVNQTGVSRLEVRTRRRRQR